MKNDLNEYLEIALQAAKKSGDVLLSYWGNLKIITEKSTPGDFVTEADKASEVAVISYFNEKTPGFTILSEESGLQNGRNADFEWVIDPLDGTTNYAHQYPVFAISIGLVYQGKPVVGVVFNPVLNELFYAVDGGGAFFNGQKMSVSKVPTVSRSLLSTGFPYDRRVNPDNNYKEFAHLTQLSQGVRRGGAAAIDLAYVAAGKLDGYWESGIRPWDIAAGMVLVKEAGGTVSSYDLSELDFAAPKIRILSSNGMIHREMSQEIHHVRSM